ncbi:MAG: hypothetical protein KIT68_10040 [Phycisphaeraceae bacterium]|nr:hypothetical protein [Phycisphaeraceae bacterium]
MEIKARFVLALDIGSNSVGSVWLDRKTGELTAGISIFPAGVDESDDKRGEPKNAKRRMTRRTRITLARRATRKRELRLRLIELGLLPSTEPEFRTLLQQTDPWDLRRRGLDGPLTAHQFGRVLLHLAQRRGALGLKPLEADDDTSAGPENETGRLKAAIGHTRAEMLNMNPRPRTFGEFIARLRDQKIHPLTSPDRRPANARRGPRHYHDPVRNKAGEFQHAADRPMIRDEFDQLWKAQQKHAAATWGAILTPQLRLLLDDERGDSRWKHKGLLFGQRRQSWDLGTLGRCVLEPTERCVPHADMHASYFRVLETVNNFKVIDKFTGERPLTVQERQTLIDKLRGPLGVHEKGKFKGKPKRSCSVTDLREALGWGRAGKDKWPKLNAERDEDREINTDWFHREIVHGGVGEPAWTAMTPAIHEGINRLLLRYDPEQEGDDDNLASALGAPWSGLAADQVARIVAAWKGRPKIEQRLSMSRRAVLNLLALMEQPRPSPSGPDGWPTQIEARKLIAQDSDFLDRTTGKPLDDHARRRYATGAKGLSARDRHYLRKHPNDLPPAPLLSNPVVRRSIHEVRRHIVEYAAASGRFPDEVRIELAREAKMGAKDADRVLFRNRLRARIRSSIIAEYNLESRTPNQQRAAVDRVVLAVQQGCRCPLCGQPGLTPRKAAEGQDCEIAHILPRTKGGHNGLGNSVLAHTRCNREMRQDTPRQYWERALKGGHAEGMRFVESIFGEVERPKPSEIRAATGQALWACYFDRRDDARKTEQFTKDIKDIKDMTARQEAATKYAARQVMAYLSDALFGGRGLPERGGERLIFNNDGLWTARLRREWGLFFDPHDARSKGLSDAEEHERKEKNRADHRHHAVDAAVIALCTAQVQNAWESRERDALAAAKNPSDEDELAAYRRAHPIPVPAPFKNADDLKQKLHAAVFGDDKSERPIAHRPVKRKLIGALHEESLFGPVLDANGAFTGNYTARKSVLALSPNHLRVPDGWDALSAKAREGRASDGDRRASRAQLAAMPDPPPGKSGIVRDRALRDQLRRCFMKAGLDPDGFTANQAKKLAESGGFRHESGVPIRSVILLRTMSEPVIASRWARDYATGRPIPLFNADTGAGDPAAARAYVGGNNHHIEIRSATDKKGNETWSGQIVSAFEAAARKRAFLRAVRTNKVPRPAEFRKLPPAERRRFTPLLRTAQAEHPIVDRRDDPARGGRFVMSLSEGETVFMKHKQTGQPGYFVVAKLDKPNRVVLVPHWDARAATGRKDPEGKPVPDSRREDFTVTPGELRTLAAPGHPHALKVRVSPLGKVTPLDRD